MAASLFCLRPVMSSTRRTIFSTLQNSVRRDNSKVSSGDGRGFGHDDDEYENVLKVVQRFEKDPTNWPTDEQPFAMIDRRFLGRWMHMVELRPERGFANYVPFGMMLLRHMWRKIMANYTMKKFKSFGVLDHKEVRAGTKGAFELISQNAFHDTMGQLVERGVCAERTVKRFEGAGSLMSRKQRDLLNLTEKDIFSIAPGVLDQYQILRPLMHHGEPYLVYSLLCCAFYKKQLLYDAVRHLPLLDKVTPEDRLPMPDGYGYSAPRTIFGYITFGNRLLTSKEVDQEVKLLDFQFLVM